MPATLALQLLRRPCPRGCGPLVHPPRSEPLCLYCGYHDWDNMPPELGVGYSDGWPHDYAVAADGPPARPINVVDADKWVNIKPECPYDALEMKLPAANSGKRPRLFKCSNQHHIWLWRNADGMLVWGPPEAIGHFSLQVEEGA